MTQFTDGPAAGVALALRRAPRFLRVVRGRKGEWDALDLLNDTPEAGEVLTAYRLKSHDGGYFLDWHDKSGRRRGGCFQNATYEVCPEQPDEATMRETESWRNWCRAEDKKRKGGA